MRFLIVTPNYNPLSGGIVALFRLGHELCERGYQAELWSAQLVFGGRPDYIVPKEFSVRYVRADGYRNLDDLIAVYPEIIPGNPLGAHHRVRWLLHEPGYHRPRIDVDRRDYFVRYGDWFNCFRFHGMQLRNRPLTIQHIPAAYLERRSSEPRAGLVYFKGKGAAHFDPALVEGGTCIDGLGHDEMAAHFHRSERFISFDNFTFLTRLAVLCDIEVVVVPPEPPRAVRGSPRDQAERLGIALGFSEDELAFARETAPLMRAAMKERLARQSDEVVAFAEDCRRQFGLPGAATDITASGGKGGG